MEIIMKSESVLLSGHLPSKLIICLTKFRVYYFFMCLMIPEGSNAFKRMCFDALEIQEPSQIDPGSIWEFFFS